MSSIFKLKSPKITDVFSICYKYIGQGCMKNSWVLLQYSSCYNVWGNSGEGLSKQMNVHLIIHSRDGMNKQGL